MTIGLPRVVVSDNGSEFASRTLDAWASRQTSTCGLLAPASQLKTRTFEIFNGKFRDECLNEH
jgi:putative transposase